MPLVICKGDRPVTLIAETKKLPSFAEQLTFSIGNKKRPHGRRKDIISP